MRSDFKIVKAACFWCAKATECVETEITPQTRVELCWSCLKKKAKAENAKPHAGTA